MRETDIDALMAYAARDLGYAQRFLDEGEYPKSINESYYSVFYAAKAGLLHLGVRSKNHQSVQAGIDSMVDSGRLPSEMKGTLALLLSRRNEAVVPVCEAQLDREGSDRPPSDWRKGSFG